PRAGGWLGETGGAEGILRVRGDPRSRRAGESGAVFLIVAGTSWHGRLAHAFAAASRFARSAAGAASCMGEAPMPREERSHDAIDQFLAALKPLQVLEEHLDMPVRFVLVPAGGVGGDETGGRGPQRMGGRQ